MRIMLADLAGLIHLSIRWGIYITMIMIIKAVFV